MFHVSRIKYSWYGKQESYLLITIGTRGASPELWGKWCKKGYLMNDELMETALVNSDKIRANIKAKQDKEENIKKEDRTSRSNVI